MLATISERIESVPSSGLSARLASHLGCLGARIGVNQQPELCPPRFQWLVSANEKRVLAVGPSKDHVCLLIVLAFAAAARGDLDGHNSRHIPRDARLWSAQNVVESVSTASHTVPVPRFSICKFHSPRPGCPLMHVVQPAETLYIPRHNRIANRQQTSQTQCQLPSSLLTAPFARSSRPPTIVNTADTAEPTSAYATP